MAVDDVVNEEYPAALQRVHVGEHVFGGTESISSSGRSAHGAEIAIEGTSAPRFQRAWNQVAILFQQVTPGDAVTFHVKKLFGAITRLQFAPFEIGDQFFPDRLRFPNHYGIGVLLRLVRAYRNVNAAENNLFAALPEKIGQLICCRSHVRHGRDAHQIGILIEIDGLDAFVHDAHFDVRRGNGRQNCQIEPRKSRARFDLHIFRYKACYFEHLRRAKDVVRIVGGNEQELQRIPLSTGRVKIPTKPNRTEKDRPTARGGLSCQLDSSTPNRDTTERSDKPSLANAGRIASYASGAQ